MMKSKLILSGKDAGDDIQPVVSDALEKQSAFAHARFKKFARECRTFEERFDMASEQFLIDSKLANWVTTSNGSTGMRRTGGACCGKRSITSFEEFRGRGS
jgi:hypothetical protein